MMACKVEKFQSPGKGNGLRAVVSVSAGDELYVAEPFAYIVKESAHGEVCEYCLSSKDRLRACYQCKYAKYCSKQCQEKAWPDHKMECNCLASIQTSTDIDTVRLAIKVLFKVLQSSPCPSENLYSVVDLECKPKHQRKSLSDEFEGHAQQIMLHVKEEIADPSELPVDLNLPELIAKVSCNRVPIINDSLMEAGIGLYPSMCLLNHSCEPNCNIVFMGKLFHLRAVRNIEAGEELTMTYIPLMEPTEKRQSRLRANYCFECDCHRCQTYGMDHHMLAGDQSAARKTQFMSMMIARLHSKENWGESLKVCRAQLKENAGLLPDENIYQLELLDSAVNTCIELGRQKEGLRYAKRALAPNRLYTPAGNYATGVLLIKIATMQMAAGQIFKSIKSFTEVREIMETCLGGNHPYTKELTQSLTC